MVKSSRVEERKEDNSEYPQTRIHRRRKETKELVMLETIIAGVIAHGIYHYAMDIKHSDDETHHVPSVSRTVDNKDVSCLLKVANLGGAK